MNEVNYTIYRGEDWKRLFIVKDRRTRRKRVPTAVAATVLIDTIKYVLPTTVTTEGGVLLALSPNNTEWMVDGTYSWDSVATVSASPLLTSTPLEETVVVHGTLTVKTYDNLTPMASDGVPEALAVLA